MESDSNSKSDVDTADVNVEDIDRDIRGKFHTGFVSGFGDDEVDVEEDEEPTDSNEKQILQAAENGNIDLVSKLLEVDAKLTDTKDKDGYTPLHRAAYNNQVQVLDMLLEEGASITAETVDGWTPLHSACHWNSASCAEKLISVGADVNRKSQGGITPLHLAASNNQSIETLQTLLFHPTVDTSITNNSHETAYEIALRKSRSAKFFEIVESCFNYI